MIQRVVDSIARRLGRAVRGTAHAPERPRVPLERRHRFNPGVAPTNRRSGSTTAAVGGSGIEADTMRPWTEGDPARMIDWRVTARMGEPWIRTRLDERELPVRILLDLPDSPDPELEGQLLSVAEWVARSASAAGHPVGLVFRGPNGLERHQPARGRRTLGRLLGRIDRVESEATAGKSGPGTVADALRAAEGPGTVVWVSSFDFQPSLMEAVEDAVARLGRRGSVIPVRLERHGVHLSDEGVLSVRRPDGSVHLLDTASPAVRERWTKGIARWREACTGLERWMQPGVVIERGASLSPIFARLTGNHRSPGGRASRRSLRRIASVLLAAIVSAGTDVAAQMFPGSGLDPTAEVLTDHMPDLVELGAPIRRVVSLRWAAGPALPLPVIRSPGVDVRVRKAILLGEEAGAPIWEVSLVYQLWSMGEQELPPVTLAGVEAGRAVVIRPRRLRVIPPVAPATSLAPTLPAVRGGHPAQHLRWLPPVLFFAGVFGFVLALIRGGSSERVRSGTHGGAPMPVTPIDAIVQAVRGHLAEHAGPHPGWTGRSWESWASEELDRETAVLVRDFSRLVDEARFRPALGMTPEVGQAQVLAGKIRAATSLAQDSDAGVAA